MSDDMLDEDGYPTDETLAKIKDWPWDDALGCLDHVRALWRYPDWVTKTEVGECHHFRFATGGWSGNEELIGALHSNVMIRCLTWQMSQAGGLHIYHVMPMQAKE